MGRDCSGDLAGQPPVIRSHQLFLAGTAPADIGVVTAPGFDATGVVALIDDFFAVVRRFAAPFLAGRRAVFLAERFFAGFRVAFLAVRRLAGLRVAFFAVRRLVARFLAGRRVAFLAARFLAGLRAVFLAGDRLLAVVRFAGFRAAVLLFVALRFVAPRRFALRLAGMGFPLAFTRRAAPNRENPATLRPGNGGFSAVTLGS